MRHDITVGRGNATAQIDVQESMSERSPFFREVDQVINILEELSRLPTITPNNSAWRDRRVTVVQETSAGAQRWEDTIQRLHPYRTEVLQHVARLFRAREGQLNRRMMTIVGNSRGAGILGTVLAAFAVSSFFSTLRTWLPAIPVEWFVAGFTCVFTMILFSGWSVLVAVHPASHLLYLADLLDAAVALRDTNIDQQQPTQEGDPKAAFIS